MNKNYYAGILTLCTLAHTINGLQVTEQPMNEHASPYALASTINGPPEESMNRPASPHVLAQTSVNEVSLPQFRDGLRDIGRFRSYITEFEWDSFPGECVDY